MKVLKEIRSNSDLVDDFENKRIVIVDDSTMSRKILRDLFEEAGLKVVAEAADGIEGVLAYKHYGPDLITLDITMPNMDGVHALKEIKNYDRDAKAIMITAAGQEKMVIDALKNGADKFITKPFDKDEVLKTVKELVNAD
jgi:DNA-binding response OmpR family regulator